MSASNQTAPTIDDKPGSLLVDDSQVSYAFGRLSPMSV